MAQEDATTLLLRARTVLERYMFDESDAIRDDIAEVCIAIDDVLPDAARVEIKRAELERVADRSAA